jgi:hypothetical protein
MRILEARDAYPIAPIYRRANSRPGKVRHVLLMLLLGVPIPLILLVLLIRGCVV